MKQPAALKSAHRGRCPSCFLFARAFTVCINFQRRCPGDNGLEASVFTFISASCLIGASFSTSFLIGTGFFQAGKSGRVPRVGPLTFAAFLPLTFSLPFFGLLSRWSGSGAWSQCIYIRTGTSRRSRSRDRFSLGGCRVWVFSLSSETLSHSTASCLSLCHSTKGQEFMNQGWY